MLASLRVSSPTLDALTPSYALTPPSTLPPYSSSVLAMFSASAMTPAASGFLTVVALLFGYLALRVFVWLHRIHTLRKSMPVIPVLLGETSFLRFLWPKSWQTYHRDWHMHRGRSHYQNLNSDVFALVSLFGPDNIISADPRVLEELNVTGFHRFQINLDETELVSTRSRGLMN
jgi:hypothetical protein